MLKILGRETSINVRKVLWVLDELALAYEREDWGLPMRDPRVPEFLRLNPNGQVPVLVDGEFVLWESNAVMRYLAAGQKSALIPSNQKAQALMEQWLGWQATELNPAWGYAVYALARREPGYDNPERIAGSISTWTEKMRILEAQLGRTSAYAAGSEFTLADIALGLSVHRWFHTPFDHPDLPMVRTYYDQLRTRQAAQAWMDDRFF